MTKNVLVAALENLFLNLQRLDTAWESAGTVNLEPKAVFGITLRSFGCDEKLTRHYRISQNLSREC